MWLELRRLARRLHVRDAGPIIEHAELRDFAENAQIAMLAYSLEDLLVLNANEASAGVVGRQRKEIVGRSLADVLHGWQDAKPITTVARTVVTEGRCLDVQVLREQSSNGGTWYHAYGWPIGDHKGVLAIVDVTGQTRKSLQERQQAEAFSVIAHELRNALTGVKGYGQIALEVQDERRQAALDGLSRSIGAFAALVDQMLDAARLGVGSYKLRRCTINLISLVTEALEQRRLLSEQHDFILQMAEPEVLVDCDPICISRVLTNLLDNAVKYSPSGREVVVGAWQRGDEAVVTVRDYGIGMSEEEMTHIFDRFYRASGAIRVRSEGLGLGLYIVRELLALHEGRLWVESVEGEGSTFYFTLPVTKGTS